MNKGVLYGVLAFLWWGLFPLYWRALEAVSALQILSHRIVWSIFWLIILISFYSFQHRSKPNLANGTATGLGESSPDTGWTAVITAVRNPVLMRTLLVASIMLSINWGLYIWAVNSGRVVETSLGYFINPLISVLFGMVFLKERLWPIQTAAVIIAGLGVLYLTWAYGQLPWISLTLAISFAYYGLLKKRSPLKAAEGLFVETMFVFGFALAYLLWAEWNGTGAFLHTTWDQNLLLVMAGVATAMPLVLFAAAAQRIPLSMVGFLQYIAPTIQFMLGVFLYNEPFSLSKLIGFCLIWTALIIFTFDGVLRSRRARLEREMVAQYAN